jgi:excisionase family DNA binding protein
MSSSEDTEPDAGPEWLTVDEYARVMRRTRRTVERWIASGALPVRRHGRTTRIHRREIEPEDDHAEGSADRMRANVYSLRR